MLFAFVFDTPVGIARGIWRLILHPDALITDYSAVGGFGATFFNAGLIMAISTAILKLSRVMFCGPTIACVFLMSALYGTALSPMITEVALQFGNYWQKLLAVMLCGIIIGFMLPPLATYCLRVHQGYNLYNVGFAAGLVGTLLVSIMKSFGYEVDNSLSWTYENNWIVVAYILTLSFVLMAMGWFGIEDKKSIKRIYRHSGRLVADFVLMDGLPVTLFNMGSLGIVATLYILITGGTINGATMGGILTIIGFGAFGKHLRNVIPVVGGVYLGSLVKVWNINDPSVQLAALFGTSLAPISGQFGWPYGLLVGFIHSSMALNTGILHAGLNLYNNGFSAGILALIIVPIIETFKKHREQFVIKRED